VDDIISTGGTMVRACSALRERGADEIYLACSHGLFLGDSLSRLKGSCDGLATTDSLKENLNREVELIRLAPLVSSYLAES
jgi:ribose-phosphate pyrophosphokinase